MDEKQVQQFISTAHYFVQQAKLGEVATRDNTKKKQIIESTTAALGTAKRRIAELEAKCEKLEARCDDLTDRLRESDGQLDELLQKAK